MGKIYLAAAALFLACAVVTGQEINPTVEVTNTYQGGPSEVHKPLLDMAIPDSLTRFDMDFGYEVFEKPYQGAYNFKPYMLNMRPGKDAYRGRSLYLRAGAGYSLHPQLEFVFSPGQDGPFQMGVYTTHKSYIGKYNVIRPFMEDDAFKFDKVPGKSYSGHDALTTAGFEGSYNWDNSILTFGIGYYGLMAGDTLRKRSYNAADFNARIRSNRKDESYLFYDAALEGRFGNDRLDKQDIREGIFRMDANVGPVLDYFHRFLVGLEAETCSYGGDMFKRNAGRIALVPKYGLETGRWKLSLGLRIEKLFRGSQDDTPSYLPMHQQEGKTFYPDVHASYTLLDNLLLHASITGGSRMHTYSSLIASNHHLTPAFAEGVALMDNSVERMNVKVGIKGNLWSRLQFDLSGGGTNVLNGLVDAPVAWTAVPAAIGYCDYSLAYADLLLGLDAGGFRLDAGAHYRSMSFDADVDAFKLPVLSGSLRAVYNFNPRVYAGVNAEAAAGRGGSMVHDPSQGPYANPSGNVRIPGYLDLGFLAGYQVNRRLGVWLESGNLLCESIQRNPYYAEKDLWVTGGITLSL